MPDGTFKGCMPALMTPCDAGRRPDIDAMVQKGKDLIEAGMSAVVYCGSMGDWPLLTDADRQEGVARLAAGPWNRHGQLGLVVGATYPAELARVRELAPTLPLLIPGVGAQGGDATATVRAAWRADAPIVVNSSRAVLYAADGADWAAAARRAADTTRRALNAART